MSEKMRAVLVEPGETARTVEMGTGLRDLQSAVMGYIETCYPFEDQNALIVCNEEGKINGLPANRAIYDSEGDLADIICGPFVVCSFDGEDFASLSDEQIGRYTEQFRYPERFEMTSGRISVTTYMPGERDEFGER